jgi:hypothetical protein
MVPHWVWTEADVRQITEAAGFDDVRISHARVAGDNRLGNLLGRLMFGTDEERILVALKPVPVHAADDAKAEEAVAVG